MNVWLRNRATELEIVRDIIKTTRLERTLFSVQQRYEILSVLLCMREVLFSDSIFCAPRLSLLKRVSSSIVIKLYIIVIIITIT